MREIRFYFDVVCPYAWIASTRIEGIARRASVRVRWCPVLLGGVLRSIGADPDPNGAMPDSKRALVRLDMARQAALWGLPLSIPEAHPRRTVDAMRLLVAAPEEAVPALAGRLFRAYWVEGADLADRAVLRAIGAEHGLDADRLVEAPEIRDRLRRVTDEAAERGVFGVPTVFVGEDRFFGADRLRLVEQALGLDETEPEPEGLAARADGALIELFHDVASPFSYLAHARIGAIAEAIGAEVVPRPILVGALFRAIGTPMVPVATFPAAKQDHVQKDLARWAARAGVPFRFASSFPIRSLLAQRVCVAEPSAAAAIYRAAWGEDRDVSSADGLRRVLDDASFDGAALLARAQAQEIKDELRENTDRAVALGVCGVPTCLVGGALFWGQDRLDQVALAARGWRHP